MTRIIILLFALSIILFGCYDGETYIETPALHIPEEHLNEFDEEVDISKVEIKDYGNNVFLFIPDYNMPSAALQKTVHVAFGVFIKEHPELELKSHTFVPTTGGRHGEFISAVFEPKARE